MRQTLHIFKKDVRYLRYEIALILLFALALAVVHVRPAHQVNNSWWAELGLVAATAFLIGRLVLAESIPGDRQFWITRPYRWQSLLGAKLLFMATFVNLPVLLVHLFILIIDGFPLAPSVPGLFWSQVLLFVIVALPFATLATLNSGMAPFIFSQLIVLAAVYGVWQMLPRATPQLGGVEWLPDSIAVLFLAAICGTVLWVQYKSRRTLASRSLAIGAIAIGAVLFMAVPWPVALAVQTKLSKQPSLGSSIELALGPQFGERSWVAQTKPKVALHLPISMQGIPNGTEIHADALSISLEDAGGGATTASTSECFELTRQTISRSVVIVSAVCLVDPKFFQRQHGHPVTLRAALYFTLFGNARSQTIPLSDEPANVLDGLQCYTDTVKAEWDIYCRSAFRWPARLIYTKLGDTNAKSFTQIVSYSPFPAGLNIDPMETRWASAYAAGPPPTERVRNVTIVVEEPLAHLRHDLEAHDVALDDFVFPSTAYPPIEAIHSH